MFKSSSKIAPTAAVTQPAGGGVDGLLAEAFVPLAVTAAGENHSATRRTLVDLARVLKDEGKRDEAERILNGLLDSSTADGPDWPFILSDLGRLLQEKGQLDEAETLCRQAVEVVKARHGEDHQDTAQMLSRLARVLMGKQKYEEAEGMFRRALQISEEVHGEKHKKTANALDNLAIGLYEMGQLEEAKTKFERALEMDEQNLGPEHPRTGITVYKLARVLYDMGQQEEAKGFFPRAESIDEATKGAFRHKMMDSTLRPSAPSRRPPITFSKSYSLPTGEEEEKGGVVAISPLEPGDRVSIIKPGSSKYGDEVEVIDPSWYGMVKVAHEEGVKSYLAEHLNKVEE